MTVRSLVKRRHGSMKLLSVVATLATAMCSCSVATGTSNTELQRQLQECRQAYVADYSLSRIQIPAMEFATFSPFALQGDAESIKALKESQATIGQFVDELQHGGRNGVLKSHVGEPKYVAALDVMSGAVKKAGMDIAFLESNRVDLAGAQDSAYRVNSAIPKISASEDELARAMSDANARPSQIGLVNRQIVLLYSMSRHISEMLDGGEVGASAADALNRDNFVWLSVSRGMKNGNPEMGLLKLQSPKEQLALKKVMDAYDAIAADLDSIIALSGKLKSAGSAIDDISSQRLEILSKSQDLYDLVDAGPQHCDEK